MSASDDVGKGLDLAMLIAIGIGGYFLYQFLKGLNPFNPNTVPGAALNATSSAIASAYENLTFGPPIEATGTVADENGNVLGPISSFPAMTLNGITYLQIGGQTYELGPRNAQGNFTAIPPGGSTGPTGATMSAGNTTPGNTSPGGTGLT